MIRYKIYLKLYTFWKSITRHNVQGCIFPLQNALRNATGALIYKTDTMLQRVLTEDGGRLYTREGGPGCCDFDLI